MSQLEACNRDEWEMLVTHYPEANFLQSWEWGEAHREMGHEIMHHKLVIDDEVRGLVLGIIRNARRGRYLEIAGGPLIDWSDQTIAADMLKHITKYYIIKTALLPRQYIYLSLNDRALKTTELGSCSLTRVR